MMLQLLAGTVGGVATMKEMLLKYIPMMQIRNTSILKSKIMDYKLTKSIHLLGLLLMVSFTVHVVERVF